MIKKLTEAQEEQVSLYRRKWEAIALAPGPIDHALAKVAVQSAYSLLNLPPPDILFRPSPCAAVETVVSRQFGVESREDIIPRPSHLDLDVPISVHPAPDVLSFRFCSCGYSHDSFHGWLEGFLSSS